MMSALMLAVATMMMPVSASAAVTFYYDRAIWSAAVGTSSPVDLTTLPNPYPNGTSIFLPSGNNDFFNLIDYSVSSMGITNGFIYSGGTQINGRFYTNGGPAFWQKIVGPVNEFGFDLAAFSSGTLVIQLWAEYAPGQGYITTQTVTFGDTEFLGWIADSGDFINGFTTSSSAKFGLGNFVQGGVAPIPEPGTMMLLGSGLVGLAGYARKKIKK